MAIDKGQIKSLVKDFLSKISDRFKQELIGENEELIERSLREHCAGISRIAYKNAQVWSKWSDDSPVLMPDNTRIYYRKGATEIVVQEFAPQIRIIKFKGALAKRDVSTHKLDDITMNKVYNYSLALPYIVFIFKFVEGTYEKLFCSFSDRPLKNLSENPIRPYLSNINSELEVCLGGSFNRDLLETNNIAQQCAYVLSHFWHSVYSDEFSQHYWNYKTHFKSNDLRLATLDAWQEASYDNPLFVIEDVNWLPIESDNFGDIIVKLLSGDSETIHMQDKVFKEISEAFSKEVLESITDNFDKAKRLVEDTVLDTITDEFCKQF